MKPLTNVVAIEWLESKPVSYWDYLDWAKDQNIDPDGNIAGGAIQTDFYSLKQDHEGYSQWYGSCHQCLRADSLLVLD